MLAYSCLLAVLGTASRIEEAGKKVGKGTATPGTKTSVARPWLRNEHCKTHPEIDTFFCQFQQPLLK